MLKNNAYSEETEIIPGVFYGREDHLLSPAYWKARCALGEAEGHDFISKGSTLSEEVGFCLLGGFGVKVEINEAFYDHLKKHGAFSLEEIISEETLLELLSERLPINNRLHKYRFPRQKAKRIHNALSALKKINLNYSDPKVFRDQILALDGVGPKTASWITRNWLGAESVAILDIHILRAGHLINLFEHDCILPKDYQKLEDRFLQFAEALSVRASVLDAVIWSDMRDFGSRLVLRN